MFPIIRTKVTTEALVNIKVSREDSIICQCTSAISILSRLRINYSTIAMFLRQILLLVMDQPSTPGHKINDR